MFRKTGMEVHKEIFAEACNKYQRQLELTILVIKYNTALEKICNELAPMKSRWITHRPHAP